MSSLTGHELLEVPDTPDRLDRQSGGCSHRDVDAKNLKLSSFQEKSLENKDSSSRRQDQIVGEKAVSGSSNDLEQNEKRQDMERVVKIGLLNRRPRSSCKSLVQNSVSSCFSGTSSCRLQSRSSRENGFTQGQGHVEPEDTANSFIHSEMVPIQHFSHQTPRLQRQSTMDTCKASAEDENIQRLNVSPNGKMEDRRKGKEIISTQAIISCKQPQRKALVRNGRISPINIDVDATIPEKSVKKISEVVGNMNVSVTDDRFRDINTLLNQVLKPDGDSLPHVSQREDRRKGKEIISGHIIECKDNDAPLRKSRKRTRVNPLSCEGGVKAVASYNSTSPRLGGLSCSPGKVSGLDCGNDNLLNRSIDNASEGYTQLSEKPAGCSKIRCQEKLLRSDRNRARAPYSSLAEDQEHCFEPASSSCMPDSCNQQQQANVSGNFQHSLKRRRIQIASSAQASSTLAISDASPEVIFVRSSRPLRNNSSSTSSTNAVVHAPAYDVDEAASHEPIDVDSLASPSTGSVNIDPSNGEADARARQIEEDEILARQLQEAFQDEVSRDGYQNQDGHLHWTVQRERSTRISSPASGSVLPARPHGFPMSFRTGETSGRESIRSLRNLPTRPNNRFGPAMTTSVRRRDQFLGRLGRLRRNMDEGFLMRSVDGRRTHFPSHMNLEMRINFLEALERAAEGRIANEHLAGIQRDFNENDYEMLLALDDGNESHRGASQRHIDRLPVSTVQNDVLDETCSICLEMPRAGEAIRHLLCMHKFHKDCIDPWLSRQATCPICKSSI